MSARKKFGSDSSSTTVHLAIPETKGALRECAVRTDQHDVAATKNSIWWEWDQQHCREMCQVHGEQSRNALNNASLGSTHFAPKCQVQLCRAEGFASITLTPLVHPSPRNAGVVFQDAPVDRTKPMRPPAAT